MSAPLHYRNAQRPAEILKSVAVRKSVFKMYFILSDKRATSKGKVIPLEARYRPEDG